MRTHPLPPVTQPNELKSGGSFMNATIMRSAYNYTKKCYQVKAAKCSLASGHFSKVVAAYSSSELRLLSFPGPSPHARSSPAIQSADSSSAFPQFFFSAYMCVCMAFLCLYYVVGRHRHEKELSDWAVRERAAARQSVSRNHGKASMQQIIPNRCERAMH